LYRQCGGVSIIVRESQQQTPNNGTQKMTTAQIKMNSLVGSMTTAMLCEAFELTNGNKDAAIPTVRGAIMDELESRDPEAFDKWMDSDVVTDMDKPSKFFA
jgi:hypothetical protein